MKNVKDNIGAISWCIILLISGNFALSKAVRLSTYISLQGVTGEVVFEQGTAATPVTIRVALHSDEPVRFSWNIREFPADYRNLGRCAREQLGNVVVNLDDIVGPLVLPDNSSSEVTTDRFSLTGENGIWGRSLLLDGMRTACGTIMVDGDEKVAEARFYTPIAGSVFFRWYGGDAVIDTTIFSNLYHVTQEKPVASDHKWQIFTTDILDSTADKERESCNFLQILFDPDFRDDHNCSKEHPQNCKAGDLTRKLGPLRVGARDSRFSRRFFRDISLVLPELDSARSLYLVIYDRRHDDSFLACSKIRKLKPRIARAFLQSKGVKGKVEFMQQSPFDPTVLSINLTNLQGRAGEFHVHELPVPPRTGAEEPVPVCHQTGGHYNPDGWNPQESPAAGYGTNDQYELGDLSGKHGKLSGLDIIEQIYWDANLPLFGPHSIIHRSIVINEDGENSVWICANIASTRPMTTALIVFRYPIVGRMIFRQEVEDPLADTTIYVESLVYSDGSKNDTNEHRWYINANPTGKDFYNWTGRCLSAGPQFNPYKVNTQERGYSDCNSRTAFRCMLGDLERKHGTLTIVGRKEVMSKTRYLFTDSNLPLHGPVNILGYSLVIHDDNGPKARGDRIACSTIGRQYRQKAVVRDWYGNGHTTDIRGKIEFLQPSEYDLTDVEVDLSKLEDNSGFHIHMTPVQSHLEFPCEESTLYGHWNPLGILPGTSPPSGEGTADEYEMGDLSGKYGTLDGLTSFSGAFNDSNLPLYGPLSIIGRSVVIHKKDKNQRWACATVERGYAPSEARELRAIASFHHPNGFAYGYLRMTQLVYNDGSKSDTAIEVNLRHPGKNNRNVTRNHNWAIFVNPVGQDAAVKTFNTRCVAGGYRWNPYYTQLADPNNDELYQQECGPDNPLRCDVGDVSGRLGTIDIGAKRQVFTDINFPLEGPISAIGKSIVIYNKNGRGEKFACANIEPDKDIIKYANIRKPPRFVVSKFVDDVREVMGLPEWMLTVDSRKTKDLHGGSCIQFLLHFKGPLANQLEQDFSRLLSTGKLSQPSLFIPGALPDRKRRTSLSYRQCGSRDPTEKRYRVSGGTTTVPTVIIIVLSLSAQLLFF